MERELDGREGDDERTENERSPPPRSRPSAVSMVNTVKPREQAPAKNPRGERRSERRSSREHTPRKDLRGRGEKVIKRSPNHEDSGTGRRRSRSRSALRDRDQSGLNDETPDKSNEKETLRGTENGIKRRRRLRNRNRSSRKRQNRQDRRYKPYTELSWEERKERDEQEAHRAALRRANRPTPYNTTQFLMEDHKVDTPDLSNTHPQCDSSDEILDDDTLMNGDYLERDFSAVYEEVQSERLESMSKEQLVTEVLTLQRRVTELEEEQKTFRTSSAGESDHSSTANGQPVDKGLRRRLESLSSLEGEVQRLRSENSKLKKASQKEPVSH